MRTHFIYRQQNSWNHSMNANRFSIHSIPFGSINSMFIGTRFIQTYFWWTRSTNNYYGNKFIPINIFISADLFFTSFTFTRSLFLFCNFHFCGVPVLFFFILFFSPVLISVQCLYHAFWDRQCVWMCARTDCQTYLCIHKICILCSNMNQVPHSLYTVFDIVMDTTVSKAIFPYCFSLVFPLCSSYHSMHMLSIMSH